MDFSINSYNKLLQSLIDSGYKFQTFTEFLEKPQEKVVMLRHDVDLLPKNSLRFAQIQNRHGIKATYYFRAVKESWDDEIIKQIEELGHEVGYHYECLTTTGGDMIRGIQDFEKNLEKLRKLVKVSSICMHGSPRSKYDSKDLWKKYDYRDYDLIGEPYFDLDFDKVFYLTDTGRRWDGNKVSVRDKVETKFDFNFHSTTEIINALKRSELPDKIMINFHPQRWHDQNISWVKELILQNLKNIVKKYFFVSK